MELITSFWPDPCVGEELGIKPAAVVTNVNYLVEIINKNNQTSHFKYCRFFHSASSLSFYTAFLWTLIMKGGRLDCARYPKHIMTLVLIMSWKNTATCYYNLENNVIKRTNNDSADTETLRLYCSLKTSAILLLSLCVWLFKSHNKVKSDLWASQLSKSQALILQVQLGGPGFRLAGRA